MSLSKVIEIIHNVLVVLIDLFLACFTCYIGITFDSVLFLLAGCFYSLLVALMIFIYIYKYKWKEE